MLRTGVSSVCNAWRSGASVYSLSEMMMPRGLVDTDLRTASNSSCGVAATPMVTEMPRSAAALTTPCDTDAK